VPVRIVNSVGYTTHEHQVKIRAFPEYWRTRGIVAVLFDDQCRGNGWIPVSPERKKREPGGIEIGALVLSGVSAKEDKSVQIFRYVGNYSRIVVNTAVGK
jgi:hypothetical protein